MAKYKFVQYSVENHIAEIVLDKPPLNLIDRELTEDYFAALDEADQDPEVRVIIVTGAGRGLSGGVDLKYIGDYGASEMREFLSLFYIGMVKKVRGLTKPILAAVHGFAREGACTIAFTCDMVVAADDATFGYPGVPNLAGPPGMHVWHLQKLMGRMKAAELIFTGDPIDAHEADKAGLVTKVVPRADLMDEARKLAARIAEMSPLALKNTRELFYRMEDMPFSQVPNTALDALSLAFSSHDSKEARAAFNEKRKPVWQGK